jgi:undecaprenyl diphosphate synthase
MTHSRSSEAEHSSDSDLLSKLDPDLLPKHLAVIMDGNGRWAELRGLPRIAGHQEGIKSVREVITLCLELGIKVLTIYAFSQENWNRPAQEISALMGLLEHYLSTERSSLIEQGVRFRAIGRVDSLPSSALGAYNGTRNHAPGSAGFGGRLELRRTR